MAESTDPILTVEEAAALLKVKPSTVKAWARAGKLPGAFKLSKEWRFNRSIMLAELGKAQPVDVDQEKDGNE